MLWTFLGINLILGVLLVQFLKTMVKKVSEKYFIYPSEAVVDQTTPAEIIEHIMTYMDPCALLECRLVSKYWRNHAMKPKIEQAVMDRYDLQMKLTKLPYLGDKNLSYEPIWLDETDYPRKWLLRDRALAVKHGKQLLEINNIWLNRVLKAFEVDKKAEKTVNIDDFIIKALANKNSVDRTTNYLNMGEYQDIRFENGTVPTQEWHSWDNYIYVDCMFDLADYFDSYKRNMRQQRVYSMRERYPTKYFGFVPLNSDFLQVLAFIFVPLLVHDVLYSEFLSTVKVWFGPLSFLLALFVNVVIVLDFKQTQGMVPVYKKAAMIFWTLLVTLSLLAYPYSSTYYAFVGMTGLTFVYVVLIYEYMMQFRVNLTSKRMAPGLIALVLVLLLNDWKYAVDSIRNGAIVFRLFDNTVCFALMCLNFIALNCFSHIGSSRQWEWRYLLAWDKSVVSMIVKSYAIVIFLTLYAPTWKGNHL